jgi:hypothetical protein
METPPADRRRVIDRVGTAYRIRTGGLRLERAVSWASRRMRQEPDAERPTATEDNRVPAGLATTRPGTSSDVASRLRLRHAAGNAPDAPPSQFRVRHTEVMGDSCDSGSQVPGRPLDLNPGRVKGQEEAAPEAGNPGRVKEPHPGTEPHPRSTGGSPPGRPGASPRPGGSPPRPAPGRSASAPRTARTGHPATPPGAPPPAPKPGGPGRRR